eukprot:CAMPEP_0113458046 /NCGR_PEP_ID=MMETSP0014_2-20120614/9719_1 /TAXON_ID=2857 /ORGANISM="Nitzschia sp." /LENGTH=518 /DNA_ID=CAMNT_0000349555 /DNA_START=387 /DNA_END=1943 /DNA_ORIENTATION=- /assembly_acc=CAM_ASM_000159
MFRQLLTFLTLLALTLVLVASIAALISFGDLKTGATLPIIQIGNTINTNNFYNTTNINNYYADQMVSSGEMISSETEFFPAFADDIADKTSPAAVGEGLEFSDYLDGKNENVKDYKETSDENNIEKSVLANPAGGTSANYCQLKTNKVVTSSPSIAKTNQIFAGFNRAKLDSVRFDGFNHSKLNAIRFASRQDSPNSSIDVASQSDSERSTGAESKMFSMSMVSVSVFVIISSLGLYHHYGAEIQGVSFRMANVQGLGEHAAAPPGTALHMVGQVQGFAGAVGDAIPPIAMKMAGQAQNFAGTVGVHAAGVRGVAFHLAGQVQNFAEAVGAAVPDVAAMAGHVQKFLSEPQPLVAFAAITVAGAIWSFYDDLSYVFQNTLEGTGSHIVNMCQIGRDTFRKSSKSACDTMKEKLCYTQDEVAIIGASAKDLAFIYAIAARDSLAAGFKASVQPYTNFQKKARKFVDMKQDELCDYMTDHPHLLSEMARLVMDSSVGSAILSFLYLVPSGFDRLAGLFDI